MARRNRSITHIIGIDEAGRGPLAGPVAVGAVCVPVGFSTIFFRGARDSKKLTEKAREEWFSKIRKAKKEGSLDYRVALVGSQTVDALGMTRAVRTAISRILKRFDVDPGRSLVLLDGLLYAPKHFSFQKTIIGGDDKRRVISAASIMAKVTRDRRMKKLSRLYTQYNFETHKGYGTKAHREAIKLYGPCEIHRKSFLRKIV